MKAVQYASQLIEFDTVSSKSNVDVTHHLNDILQSLGFETETIAYDIDGVTKTNVMGRKGAGLEGIAYFGHTDVVPVDDWSVDNHGPFEPTVLEGRLYGRGSTDMKGSIACMLAAIDDLQGRKLRHPIYVSCSADEELDHRGIKEVTQRSAIYRDLVDGKACGIVGEPTCMDVVYAHKGGVQIVVTAEGKAAHSSTREGVNANLAMIPFLQEAKAIHDETEQDSRWWDQEFDPPSVCLNIGINDHTRAVNITPPQSVCTLCFRPMPDTDANLLIDRIRDAAIKHGVNFHLGTRNPAFRRDPNSKFASSCVKACESSAPRTVAYGSEAGNLDEIERLVVLGPGDISQAHKSDEWISLEQLQRATDCYRKILEQSCY